MAIVTPIEYYEGNNGDSHGNYQYVLLKDIVNDLEKVAQQDSSVLKNIKRYIIIDNVRDGVAKLTKEAANNVLGFSITVPSHLTFALPQDYVNYVRVSVIEPDTITQSKRLRVLDINNNINTAIGYLQDHNAQILFDEDGYILQSDGDNAYGQPYSKYAFYKTGSQYHLDTSKLSKHGEFTIDENRGKILFSSELEDREIVFEYISDGLQADINEGNIKVHKHIVEAVKAWAVYNCIRYSSSISRGQIADALASYKTALHQAKLDRVDFDFVQIARTFRSKSIFK